MLSSVTPLRFAGRRLLAWPAFLFAGTSLWAAPADVAASYHKKIEPLLKKYCYDCHGDGMEKGKVAFDGFATDAALLGKHSLWLAALRNTRSGMMPPHEEGVARPTPEELTTLQNWIKYEAFGIDPANPDPGKVTVRRLNRVEYRNTIRELMGFDFNAEAEFPPDDSGHGFDNNGDVLTISPLLLEKYLGAAETIIDRAVPKVAKVMRERKYAGRDFKAEVGRLTGDQLGVRQPAKLTKTFRLDQAEKYQLVVELEVRGSFDFDPGHGRIVCKVDGEEKFSEEIVWHERKTLKHEYEIAFTAGEHTVTFEVEPLELIPTPTVAGFGGPPPGALAARQAEGKQADAKQGEARPAETPAVADGKQGPRMADAKQGPEGAAKDGGAKDGAPNAGRGRGQGQGAPRQPATSLNVAVASVQVRGPIDPKFWTTPDNHARFFPKGPASEVAAERDQYARETLRAFASRAFRRPVEDAKVDQLVKIARSIYQQPGKTFEEGMGRAMMAVLASPRFLFRVEQPEAASTPVAGIASIDEYALASRLSYFLWSTMPDEELFKLAEKRELRANLAAQVKRMLADSRGQAFVKNFTGQWLQARDIESVPVNVRTIFGFNAPAALRTRENRIEFDSAFRKVMRSETEMYFDYVVREDRSVLELIDSDYTFLNEKLAGLYGVPEVTGEGMRLVKLPADSVRGGVLTHGSVLTVTSNPTRTSPVKRGLFILENILGTPPPPPPPNVPDLEDAKKDFKGREPKLSEMLALHRQNALCSSCHERMDPLGLAMENFNALGYWRDKDAGQPIEPAGKLATGETFADIRALKKVLVGERRMDYYRCITEKLMTYALGRGVEHYDTHTVDQIAGALEREGGKMSVLLMGVIESAAFQKTRVAPATTASPGEQ